MTATVDPSWEAIDEHPVPSWYNDAKLGIFIHWGPYSVPAYADPDGDHAYAEWYPYYMYREGSDTWQYHRETYGSDVEYVDFVDDWSADQWDPEDWADLFAGIGAGYVVLTAEHHDGFPLWPSHYTRYNAGTMGPQRDIVGDLARAVRDRGLRFAGSYHANLNYYQPGFAGPFGHPAYHGDDVDSARPGPEYVHFMNAKHRELIRRYEPDLLWFDVPRADSTENRARELIAEYYETAAQDWDKEVAVNDRSATDARRAHADFYTPEYDAYDEITAFKWEACRGIGRSFGYNAVETADHHLTAAELVRLFVDIVSKNGNLLINVGPRADGTIPELQRQPLEGLGEWLEANGSAVYGTVPWAVAEDPRSDVDIRYTWADDTLYATALGDPGDELLLAVDDYVDRSTVAGVRSVAAGKSLEYEARDGLRVSLADLDLPDAPAHSFAIDGIPNAR